MMSSVESTFPAVIRRGDPNGLSAVLVLPPSRRPSGITLEFPQGGDWMEGVNAIDSLGGKRGYSMRWEVYRFG